MPIFEYRCDECGKTFEKLLKNRTEGMECPQCGRPAERVVSAFSGKSPDGPGEGGCAPASGFR